MITEVMVYEASDGTQHATHDAAVYHEQQSDLQSYIDENPIYSTGSVDGHEFSCWLKENPRIYVQLLPEERGAP